MWGHQWPSICAKRVLRPSCTVSITHISLVALQALRVFPERDLNEQFYGDVRAIPLEKMSGYGAVVQLAAISNDPMGNQFEDVTFDTIKTQ